MNTENLKEQSIHLINRTFLEITEVCDVSALTDSFIEAEYDGGCLAIEGSELKIVDFSSQSGVLKVSGLVDGIYYINKLRNKKKKVIQR